MVADATYFSDGFGVITGDLIQFEGQGKSVAVSEIDSATNTLTLNSAMSWNSGDGVALKYAGISPDIGVYEYGLAMADDQVPTTPGDPTATPVSNTQISLSWTASTDNVGIEYYNIFRCTGDCTPDAVVGTTTRTDYTDSNLTSATQYTYQLSAVDASGNVSGRTDSFTGTTHDSGDSGSGSSGDGSDGSDGSGGGCFIVTSAITP